MTQTQKKRAIIIGAVLGVLLVLGIVCSVLLKVSQPIYTKLSIALMPESIEYNVPDSDEKITFYIEENKDFDKEKDEPVNAYKVYYFKDKDKKEKVYLENGVYISDKEYAESKRADLKDDDDNIIDGAKYNVGEGAQVTVGFLFEAQTKANKVKTIVNVIVTIFAVACVAYLIYLWYLNWSAREDKKNKKLAEAQEKLSGKKPEEDE